MTARELLRHCFPWEIRPGVPAPDEAVAGAAPGEPAPATGEAPVGTPPGGPASDAAEEAQPGDDEAPLGDD